MKVDLLEACKKEIKEFPHEVRVGFLDAVANLERGMLLSMPLSRKLPSLGPHVHELRFRDRAGIYRVVYFIKKGDAIYMVHAFTKKTQKTPKKNLSLASKRIRRLR